MSNSMKPFVQPFLSHFPPWAQETVFALALILFSLLVHLASVSLRIYLHPICL